MIRIKGIIFVEKKATKSSSLDDTHFAKLIIHPPSARLLFFKLRFFYDTRDSNANALVGNI
jgi:hypothetical protein